MSETSSEKREAATLEIRTVLLVFTSVAVGRGRQPAVVLGGREVQWGLGSDRRRHGEWRA